ncbi:MAG TPA: beta-ketoacyl-[acyl-carrier-protein] synthase family protein [Mucilaginibacter sp.]|nr:beta-ketoacyl-[acyl-carrier-protein] synthase family protein [Mucilaginibacter sp.]
MSAAVFVAGAGIISGIGNNVPECLSALENSTTGIDRIGYLRTNHQGILPASEVRLSNAELALLSGFSPLTSRNVMLSMVAAKEAWDNSGINSIQGLRTGFVSATTIGGMDKTENFFIDFVADRKKGRLRDLAYHECGNVSQAVAEKLGIKHHVSTISTACSSSANAIMYGARLIKHNMLDAVIAGGTDALARFTLNGFNTLLILDEQYCQPFDENRRGLNLGEGAGYIVLVSERVAKALKKEPDCSLTGYCNFNDAYHQTASSPDGDGPYGAMTGALRMSGLQPKDIDYINLHGTGTSNNDSSEGAAIKRLFEPHYPKMSSTKTFTGHTLGASAGIEAVFSILSIKEGIVYPNLRLQTPMAELPFVPETSFSRDQNIKNVLSNSFGFGGNCSSLIFSKN